MNPRDLVYSPEQNCALWVSAWIHGAVSLDDAQDALWELDLAMDDEVLREVLAEARAARDADTGDGSGIVRLLLGGYGRPLPRGVADGFGIVSGPLMHAWSPYTDEDGFICWAHSVHDAVLFNEPHMPGEADFLLAEATRQASALIDALQPTSSRSSSLAQPRLVVGTLTDFYEAPGTPPGVAPRAEKLITRANRVAAIIETVQDRARDHAFDAQLFPLLSRISGARMAAVAAADREYQRGGMN